MVSTPACSIEKLQRLLRFLFLIVSLFIFVAVLSVLFLIPLLFDLGLRPIAPTRSVNLNVPAHYVTSYSNQISRYHRARRASGNRIASVHDLLRAEWEPDDEPINRPKLSYKKLKDKDKDKVHSR